MSRRQACLCVAAAASLRLGLASEPLLFMDTKDVTLSWGLLDPAPNQVAPSTLYRPPPGDYTHGDTVIGVLEAQGHPGTWEVYLEHANGTEPLQGAGGGLGAAEQNGWVSLLRFETRDFVSYSPARQVLYLRSGGTPTLKSIARDSRGLYVMFSTLDADVGEGAGGDHSFLSTDRGLSWREANCSTGCVVHPDKDDLNLIFNKGRFVDMQIVWEQDVAFKAARGLCDNEGKCNERRVVSAKTSTDGVNWGPDAPLILPDQLDPPDLAFYRCRPFYVGNTTRLAAHALQYAPSPSLELLGVGYGRQPIKCEKNGPKNHLPVSSSVNLSLCHGPHLHEEWWVGPASGDAYDTRGWRRPFRRFKASPHDAFLMAQPATYFPSPGSQTGAVHLWVGSTGNVYTLPLYRIAGLFSPANSVVETQAFDLPRGFLEATAEERASLLTLNADASWAGKMVTGGCDEGCGAYIMCELLDDATGAVLRGFSRKEFEPIMDADGPALPLLWRDEGGEAAAAARVRMRILFRDATIFALHIP